MLVPEPQLLGVDDGAAFIVVPSVSAMDKVHIPPFLKVVADIDIAAQAQQQVAVAPHTDVVDERLGVTGGLRGGPWVHLVHRVAVVTVEAVVGAHPDEAHGVLRHPAHLTGPQDVARRQVRRVERRRHATGDGQEDKGEG